MKASLFLLLFVSVCSGELSRTYPTSPVTTVRIDTFLESFRVMDYSSYTYKDINRNWNAIDKNAGSLVYISSQANINVWVANYDVNKSTWNIENRVWSFDEYTDHVIFLTWLKMINQILDESVEQFMVYPSTTAPILGNWKGWCLDIINGNHVPIECK